MTGKPSVPGGPVLAIIPARYASTRFPGKILAQVGGKPMIEHVYRRTRETPSVDRVIVATDDDRILQTVRNFGGECLMTGDHPTGTDRIAEAATIDAGHGHRADWVLNVQGDEPLIDSGDLERLIRGMQDVDDGVMGTLVFPIRGEEEFRDPNVVKAVLDARGRALYFSRAPIPYPREPGHPGWRHLGVYLYRADFLQTYRSLPPSELSCTEELEQLRALEHGYPIHCFEAKTVSVGVDVPEDLPRAEALLARSP